MPTEEEKVVAQLPQMVTLGGKKYEVKQMPILEMQRWREEYGAKLAKAMDVYSSAQGPSATEIFVDSPKLQIEIVCSYMGLKEEDVVSKCTEPELFAAFAAIVGFATGPFLGTRIFMANLTDQMNKISSNLVSGASSRLQ